MADLVDPFDVGMPQPQPQKAKPALDTSIVDPFDIAPQTQAPQTAPTQATDQPVGQGAAEGIVQQFAQGATLGASDEIQGIIAALVALSDRLQTRPFSDEMSPEASIAAANRMDRPVPAAPTSFAENFAQASGDIRAENEAFARENPLTSLAANLSGGVATGGAIASGARAVGAPVTGIRGAIATGGGVGAAAGAASSAPGERLEGAAKGAGFGALAGLTISGLGGLASAAKRRFAPGVENRIRAIARSSDMTPQEISTRLQALGPKATLADVDDVFMRAGDVAASRIGPASKRVQELMRRDETQFSRLMEPIRRTLGGIDDAVQTIGQLKQVRQQTASPLYERAFDQGVRMTPKMKRLLERPEIAKAWKRAKDIGMSDPEVDMRLFSDGSDPSLRGWQAITERLWDRAEALSRKGERGFAKILKNLRREVLGELDSQNSDFRMARALWAGTKQADDAVEAGANFLKPSVTATDIRDAVKGFSDSEKAFYRLGVGRAIEERLATAGDTTDLSRLFRNQAFRDKAMAAFPNKESAVDFINTVRAEARKKAVTNVIGRGSQTQPRQVAARQLGGDPIRPQDLSRAGVIDRALSAFTGPREKTIQQIGELLLSQDPSTQRRALQMMTGRNIPPLMQLTAPAAAAANLAGQLSARK